MPARLQLASCQPSISTVIDLSDPSTPFTIHGKAVENEAPRSWCESIGA
jgi:hypothetical protein